MNTTFMAGRQSVDAHSCKGCMPAWRYLHPNNTCSRNVNEHCMHGKKTVCRCAWLQGLHASMEIPASKQNWYEDCQQVGAVHAKHLEDLQATQYRYEECQ
jgi:hypothetical protein